MGGEPSASRAPDFVPQGEPSRPERATLRTLAGFQVRRPVAVGTPSRLSACAIL